MIFICQAYGTTDRCWSERTENFVSIARWRARAPVIPIYGLLIHYFFQSFLPKCSIFSSYFMGWLASLLVDLSESVLFFWIVDFFIPNTLILILRVLRIHAYRRIFYLFITRFHCVFWLCLDQHIEVPV